MAMNDRPSWQFRLSHLFGLMTLSAVAAAVAAAFGPGSLMLSGGLTVAWLNWCGLFQPVQTGNRQTVLLIVAWTIFLASLALPSMRVFGPVLGWNAAWFVLLTPFQALYKGEANHLTLYWFLGLDLANQLALMLPLLIWRLRRGQGQWLSALLCVAMVAVWIVGWDGSSMLLGYYVW